MTSFSVVSRVRRIFDQKKVGHTGTLDPDAEGVLVVCLGRATRLVERLALGTKTYEAVLLLGVTTDTQDSSGTVLGTSPVTVTEAEAAEAVLSFAGVQQQTPPMYSALKVDGKKLVDLARRGIEVERKSRQVEFSEMEILDVALPRVRFRVTCTHGAYIRTLCSDIGEKLGCGGVMEHLIRTRTGEFLLTDALTLAEIEARKKEEDAEGRKGAYTFVRPVESFYEDLPCVILPEELVRPVLNGNQVKKSDFPDRLKGIRNGQEIRLRTPEGAFVGIFRLDKGLVRTVKYYYD